MKKTAPTKPPSYFESVLQLRECDDKLLDDVVRFISKERDPDMFIAKVDKLKSGIDIFLSNNTLAVKVASHLVKTHGGRLQTSSRLFSKSRQTSKNLMRLAVLYKGLDITIGEVLALPVKKTVVKVKKLGTSVQVLDLATGKTTGFMPNRTHYRHLDKFKTRVARLRPTIQILDPETYQPVDVRNKPSVKSGEEVHAVQWLGWWIVK